MNVTGNSSTNEIAAMRLSRLQRSVGVSIVVNGDLTPDVQMIAVASSRLGLDPSLHRQACRFLTRSMLDCRDRSAVILIANGSAIDPWATRAAELFGVPVIRVFVNEIGADWRAGDHLFIQSTDGSKLCRDQVVIALADRVDAIHVRRGGNVFRAIEARLRDRDDVSTRVAITSSKDEAALTLVRGGAIGWFCSTCQNDTAPLEVESSSVANAEASDSLDWTSSDGQWLTHCTRACDGTWPGQTQRQYRDAMLLSDDTVAERTPLDTLTRILRHRKLLASAIATDHRYPVVCFSSAPLRERLRSRCYRPHLKRWDCEPYGIAIRVDAAIRLGAQPVLYGKGNDRKRLSPDEQYRFQSMGKTYDWTTEREWRVLGDVDLNVYGEDDVRIFVPTDAEARKIAATSVHGCPWKIACVAPLLQTDAIIREPTTMGSV